MRLLSDLDIMLIYQPAKDEENPQRLYTKVTQRLVSALSSVTEEGGLFEVDMALRPSGRSGPVAVTVEAFTGYYAETAWTWEYMALSRARVIAASCAAFEIELIPAIKMALMEPRTDLDMPADIADMLTRTKAEKTPSSLWDIKNIDGGLRDVEFIAQALFLKDRAKLEDVRCMDTVGMLSHAQAAGLLPQKAEQALQDAATFYQNLGQVLCFILGSALPTHERELSSAAKIMGYDSASKLEASLQSHQKSVQKLTAKYIFNAQ